MAKRSVLPTNPTAAQVRAALGKPANVRGQLSQADIDAYNKGKRGPKRYVRGNSTAAKVANEAQRAALRDAGLLKPGARGPLSKEARAFLAK